jgi:hypothetical protein
MAVFRNYSSSLGRWINRDPLLEAAGTNVYRYIFNDPISKTDSSGLETDPTQNNCSGYSCGGNRTAATPFGTWNGT